MQTFTLQGIRLYQYVSGIVWKYRPPILLYVGCRFHPTCSEYCYNAILKYGVARGGLKGLWRIIRCNPFFSGGIDHP